MHTLCPLPLLITHFRSIKAVRFQIFSKLNVLLFDRVLVDRGQAPYEESGHKAQAGRHVEGILPCADTVCRPASILDIWKNVLANEAAARKGQSVNQSLATQEKKKTETGVPNFATCRSDRIVLPSDASRASFARY